MGSGAPRWIDVALPSCTPKPQAYLFLVSLSGLKEGRSHCSVKETVGQRLPQTWACPPSLSIYDPAIRLMTEAQSSVRANPENIGKTSSHTSAHPKWAGGGSCVRPGNLRGTT